MFTRTLVLTALVLGACGTDSDTDGDTDAVFQTDVRPAGRSEIRSVVDPTDGDILIFGGNEGPIVNQRSSAKLIDETWIFNEATGWRQITVADPPARRGRYAMVYDDTNGRALMFGGRFRQANADSSEDYRLYGDLWSFDFATEAWTKLSTTDDNGPDPRYYPSGAWDPTSQRFYIWGGAVNTSSTLIEPSSDLWSWSAEEGWIEHATTGDAPSTRTFLGEAYDSKRNRLIVFGGQPGDFFSLAYNDFYALDLSTFTWERLHDGSGTAPSTRMHAAVNYDDVNDRYLVWGGHTDIGDGNDLWAFDIASGTWSIVYEGDVFDNTALGCLGNSSEVPADYVIQDVSAPERRHRGMHPIVDGKLWIFGGIHSECSDYVDDTWYFDLASETWHEVIEARTGESCERRGDACECLCI